MRRSPRPRRTRTSAGHLRSTSPSRYPGRWGKAKRQTHVAPAAAKWIAAPRIPSQAVPWTAGGGRGSGTGRPRRHVLPAPPATPTREHSPHRRASCVVDSNSGLAAAPLFHPRGVNPCVPRMGGRVPAADRQRRQRRWMRSCCRCTRTGYRPICFPVVTPGRERLRERVGTALIFVGVLATFPSTQQTIKHVSDDQYRAPNVGEGAGHIQYHMVREVFLDAAVLAVLVTGITSRRPVSSRHWWAMISAAAGFSVGLWSGPLAGVGWAPNRRALTAHAVSSTTLVLGTLMLRPRSPRRLSATP